MTHVHRPDDQGLCACGFDASPGPHVVEVAPTPSSREFAVRWTGAPLSELAAAVSARDAALLAPLRTENALLRAEATAHMENARAVVAENARLREALRDIAAPRYGLDVSDASQDHATYWSELALGYRRAAARALAEGQP